MVSHNDLGQEIGADLSSWETPSRPSTSQMVGRFCRLEAISVGGHSKDLFDAFQVDEEGRDWAYMSHGPFDSLTEFQDWMTASCLGNDPLFFAVIDLITGQAIGMASYLRIEPALGSIEVGSIHFSNLMKGKPASTEAMYLMMKRAFEQGYRRYEWKCNAFNVLSCRSAGRLGFSYEGIFRNHMIVKGRNRDTAWFAAIESEWPSIKSAFETWLSSSNFDRNGAQPQRLSDLTKSVLVNRRIDG
jgi:RimJ/RimL family protein N-acetyltransferase